MDVIISLGAGFVALIVCALALMADTVIWILPPYGRFKSLVQTLEGVGVDRVTTPNDPDANTLGRLGRRRIPEVFHTAAAVPDGMEIQECYGAFYLKDESITETISHVKQSAAILIIATLLGTVVVLTSNPSMGTAILQANIWDRIPLLLAALADQHWLLYAEFGVILTGLLYLLHNRRLIGKLVRAFEAK